MNGKLVDWADAKIHVASHVIHYGSGGLRGHPLLRHAEGLGDLPPRRAHAAPGRLREDLPDGLPRSGQRRSNEAVLETIRANELKACYIRPLIYRGYEALGVNPFPCPVDACDPRLGVGRLPRAPTPRRRAWTSASARGHRAAPNTFPSLAKTVANYANSQLIKMEAIVDGYAEGIALDTFGYLSEGSGQNLFLVRTACCYTPAASDAILPGITRDSITDAGHGPRAARSARATCSAKPSTSPTRCSSSGRPSR